jgi:hypothetical protein
MGEKLKLTSTNSTAQGSPIPANPNGNQPNLTELSPESTGERNGEIDVSLCQQHILLTLIYCK